MAASSLRLMTAMLAVEGQCMPSSEVPVPELEPGWVLVHVVSSAVNRLDTMQRKGAMAPPPGVTPVLGLEMAGVIEAVSDEAAGAGWAVGERVMALVSGGGQGETVAAPMGSLMRVPQGMGWLEAGALPETWLTAFQLLYVVGDFVPGKTVLVHAGGSGVGLAAVQLARLGGASGIFVTAGSQDKIDMAVSLGATAGFSRHDNDGQWAPLVKEQTGGAGVDLILDCVGGSYVAQNAEAAKMDGTWVLFGTLGGASCGEAPLLRLLMKKRLQLRATTLRARSTEYKADLVARFTAEALPNFSIPAEENGFRVVVDRTFPMLELQAAHEYLESNGSIGKVAIVVDQAAVDAAAQC